MVEKENFNKIVEEAKNKILNKDKKTILLFDVDGTLTPARNKIQQDMIDKLKEISKTVTIGAVGGSDLVKIKEQLGDSIELFEYVFSENGLMSFQKDKLIHKRKINEYLGEERQKELINFLLNKIADIDIPKKRGTFIEYRTGMFNVSPIGRNCSQEERNEYFEYNKIHRVTEKLKEETQNKFGKEFGLVCSIGGQISFDIVPVGWDKSYCLQFVEKEFSNIFFFGDKIYEGGNDYEIAIDKRVTQYFKTENPQCTLTILNELLPK